MRSWLFVPADRPKMLDKAYASGADALILDLEDSVGAASKGAARSSAVGFLRERRAAADRPLLYVRVNGLDTSLNESDLDMVMTAAPDGIVLPKAAGGSDIGLLDSRMAVREALHNIADGSTRVLAIATETAAALFGLGTYAGASPRVAGIAWGGEDLAADVGALGARDQGIWTEPFRIARNLCLFGAAAAGVPAIDTVYTEFRDLDGLMRESRAAARDGFSGKLVIHPDQVPIVNEAFTPDAASLERARRIVAAFAAAEGAGVTSLDGQMLDRPHLKAAERLLARLGSSLG